MGRRLEKYYLFCNIAFLSLFAIKFVRYRFIRQHTLQVGTKKACKLYRKYPIYIGSFRYIYDKIHSKLEQKKATNYLVNFRYIYRKFTLYKLEQKTPAKYVGNF